MTTLVFVIVKLMQSATKKGVKDYESDPLHEVNRALNASGDICLA